MPEVSPATAAVSNAGPLIALAKIGHLHLLSRVFERVLVPEPVANEISHAARMPEAWEILSTPGVVRIAPSSGPDPLLRAQLGAGEAAVISVALEQDIRQVLIDERKARGIASLIYGLEVVGSGGLLLRAKRRGLVVRIRPLLARMRANGYFLGDRLIEGICQEAGE